MFMALDCWSMKKKRNIAQMLELNGPMKHIQFTVPGLHYCLGPSRSVSNLLQEGDIIKRTIRPWSRPPEIPQTPSDAKRGGT